MGGEPWGGTHQHHSLHTDLTQQSPPCPPLALRDSITYYLGQHHILPGTTSHTIWDTLTHSPPPPCSQGQHHILPGAHGTQGAGGGGVGGLEAGVTLGAVLRYGVALCASGTGLLGWFMLDCPSTHPLKPYRPTFCPALNPLRTTHPVSHPPSSSRPPSSAALGPNTLITVTCLLQVDESQLEEDYRVLSINPVTWIRVPCIMAGFCHSCWFSTMYGACMWGGRRGGLCIRRCVVGPGCMQVWDQG